MKRLLCIIICFCCFIDLQAQEERYGNFIKNDNALIWQKIYNFLPEEKEAVNSFFYQNSFFTYSGNIGTAYVLLKDYTSLNYANRPIFFNDDAKVKFIVQIKENRYRVTVQSFEPLDRFVYWNINLPKEEKKYLSNFFEFYVKKNGKIRNNFFLFNNDWDMCFIKIFDYKTYSPILDDDF